jgi:hypothetical protein
LQKIRQEEANTSDVLLSTSPMNAINAAAFLGHALEVEKAQYVAVLL